MKKLGLFALLGGLALALAGPLYAQQETCEEGKTWNETTGKCE